MNRKTDDKDSGPYTSSGNQSLDPSAGSKSVVKSQSKNGDFERRVKIVCTIGPATRSRDMLKRLALAGMNVARLNFSHGSHEEHRKTVEDIHGISEELDRPIAILQDLQGPKIRVGKFKEGQVQLDTGSFFILTPEEVTGDRERVSVNYKTLPQDVAEGEMILLDDGLIYLRVEKISGSDVHCKVLKGGVLKDKKGMNLPETFLNVHALTEKDKKDVNFGLECGVDYIALSFVQSAKDILELKDYIKERGYSVPVIAKIEKPNAVKDIEHIADNSDGIMVARGDMGVELPVEEVPIVQKKIIRICIQKGIPVITATQMLESMVKNLRPTRAETTDVANAVIDGTDAVMLSAETASGDYPVEVVETMARIINLTERKHATPPERQRSDKEELRSITKAVCFTACQTANLVGAQAILCLTFRGTIAQMLARFRPQKPIYAVSDNPRTIRQLCLVWGVTPVWGKELTVTLREALTHCSFCFPVAKARVTQARLNLSFQSARHVVVCGQVE